MPSRLSRPDIPYFTHDWRNCGIISNTFLSSSLWCMMNLCDFSLLSLSLCSSGQWKQSAQCTVERLPPLSSLQLGSEGLHSQPQVPAALYHPIRATPARSSPWGWLDRFPVQPLNVRARVAGQDPISWERRIDGAERCSAPVCGAGPGAPRWHPEGPVRQQLGLLAAQAGVCGRCGLSDREEALVVPGALHPGGHRRHLCGQRGHTHEGAWRKGEFVHVFQSWKNFIGRETEPIYVFIN